MLRKSNKLGEEFLKTDILPNELWLDIFEHLPAQLIVNSLSLVSQHFAELSKSKYIWRNLYKLYFPHLYIQLKNIDTTSEENYFYNKFKEAFLQPFSLHQLMAQMPNSTRRNVYLWLTARKYQFPFDRAYQKKYQLFINSSHPISNRLFTWTQRTILHWAIIFNQSEEEIENLLKQGVNINAQDIHGATALFLAAELGNKTAVQTLLKHGANPFLGLKTQSDMHHFLKWNDTPLHAAATNSHRSIARILLKSHSIDVHGYGKDTPLHKAAAANHVNMIRFLLRNKARINQPNLSGTTPLLVAVFHGNLEATQELLNNGADPTIGLQHTTSQLPNIEMGDTAYHIAAKLNLVDILSFLLKKRGNINIRSRVNLTPLHYAAEYGHIDACKLLIEEGADVNVTTNGNLTPIMLATRNGHDEVFNCLLTNKSDLSIAINITSGYCKLPAGSTVLHFAIYWHRNEMLKTLLKEHINTNILITANFTPLHLAAYIGNNGAIELLIQHGHFINAKTRAGATPLLLAVKEGHKRAAKILLAHHADPSLGLTKTYGYYKPFKEGCTPLHFAAHIEGTTSLKMIKLLIAHGADPLVVDKDKHSAKYYSTPSTKPILTLLKYNAELKKEASNKKHDQQQISTKLINLFFTNRPPLNPEEQQRLEQKGYGKKLSKIYAKLGI